MAEILRREKRFQDDHIFCFDGTLILTAGRKSRRRKATPTEEKEKADPSLRSG
jgi:hypothetical protein